MPNPTWISSYLHLRTKALNEPGLNSKMSSGGFSFPRFPFNEGRTSPVVPHTEQGKPWSRESLGAGLKSQGEQEQHRRCSLPAAPQQPNHGSPSQELPANSSPSGTAKKGK